MQSAFSWMGTRIHLLIEDEIAANYNRAQDAFFAAQKDHRDRTGSPWDPATEPLLIDWTDEEQKAFGDIGAIINAMIEANGSGLDIPEEEMTSDYLIKL